MATLSAETADLDVDATVLLQGDGALKNEEQDLEQEQEALQRKMLEAGFQVFDRRMEICKLLHQMDEHRAKRGLENRRMSQELDLFKPQGEGQELFGLAQRRFKFLTGERGYVRALHAPRNNRYIRQALSMHGRPDGTDALMSTELSRKWATEVDEVLSFVTRSAEYWAQVEPTVPEDGVDEEGVLRDVKMLDKAAEGVMANKAHWRNLCKKSYKRYHPYAQPGAREEHLSKMKGWLCDREAACGDGTVPTDNEMMGYFLLDTLITAALNPSAIFPRCPSIE